MFTEWQIHIRYKIQIKWTYLFFWSWSVDPIILVFLPSDSYNISLKQKHVAIRIWYRGKVVPVTRKVIGRAAPRSSCPTLALRPRQLMASKRSFYLLRRWRASEISQEYPQRNFASRLQGIQDPRYRNVRTNYAMRCAICLCVHCTYVVTGYVGAFYSFCEFSWTAPVQKRKKRCVDLYSLELETTCMEPPEVRCGCGERFKIQWAACTTIYIKLTI
jgi:hypothetical protein